MNRAVATSLVAVAASQKWTVVWEDDFEGRSGSSPNPAVWNVANNPGLSGNKELEYYSPSAVYLDGNSNLVLKSTPTVTDGFNYTSGWVDSSQKFNHSIQGVPTRWEIRAKLPTGQGIWPAHWLMPDWGVCWPMGGEIDILERIDTVQGVHGALHYNLQQCGTHGMQSEGNWTPPLPFDPSQDYHIYGVTWSPPSWAGGNDTMSWSIDDLVYTTSINLSSKIPINLPYHWILNTAVGGDWPGSPNATTVWPQLHLIDWVRISEFK